MNKILISSKFYFIHVLLRFKILVELHINILHVYSVARSNIRLECTEFTTVTPKATHNLTQELESVHYRQEKINLS